ncbi:phage holin family protein [Bittarella massiliensis (ex Durand et al. 2017)]|uniref:phage holin family protein n=1 Tax=Bittarella massiliensis (ex Durand et al. 2017) TaxID=1720313 RepID=UPI001AA18BE9|nr:phage holin family protein [Bittarella massiliensis (ex Durand et al. 2017)]MBO1680422.1 phage holin family protein [Bittarella massiliensis (ex Durand et al. 2017)]
MEQMTNIKAWVLAAVGAVGGAISAAMGGWSQMLTALLIVMGADYLTGLIVAGVFHRSGKSADGSLESRAGFKGLCRKGAMLLVVLLAARLDLVMGTGFIRDGAAMAFLANELLSVVENVGLMGVPIPKVIASAISVLQSKADSAGEAE